MNFIKPCKHIRIYLTNIHIKTVRARAQFYKELLPFVILIDFGICIKYLGGLFSLYYSF